MAAPAVEAVGERLILDKCKTLDYQGVIQNEEDVSKALEGGAQSIAYTELVAWLANELRQLCDLEESVHPTSGPDDAASFVLEVSSFIKELGCPSLISLTSGAASQRLATRQQRALLLDGLAAELQAARILTVRNAAGDGGTVKAADEPAIRESGDAQALRVILQSFALAKPPATTTESEIFAKIQEKVSNTLQLVGRLAVAGPLPPALFAGHLSPDQWATVRQLNERMAAEYRIRARMLLQRLDVTIQSFCWSERVKKMEDRVMAVYQTGRKELDIYQQQTLVNVSDLLAARDDVKQIEKTSSANVRANTKSRVNKVLMKGRVPDRGGRPTEIEPPPPEMPAWQKDRAPDRGRGGRGGGRGGRGGGGGGYNNPAQHGYAGGGAGGGWSQQPQPQRQQCGLNFGGGGGGQFQAQYQPTGAYGQYDMAQQQQQYSQPQQQQAHPGGRGGGGGGYRGGGGRGRGRGRGRGY